MKIFKILACLSCALSFAFSSVNINSASTKELMSIGLNKAQALNVIKYRKAHKFKSVDELEKVKGISFSDLKKIRDKISLNDKKSDKISKK